MLMRWIAVLTIGLLLGGCGSAATTPTPSLKHTILGQWTFISTEENGQQLPNDPNVVITYDFQADGNVILTRRTSTASPDTPPDQLTSTYQFVADDVINLTIEGETRRLAVTIRGNTLTLSSQSQEFNGKAIFERLN